MSRETRTVVLFESPHRITKLLSELEERMAGRQVVIARELTKIHEEFLRGTVREVAEQIGRRKARGEYVVLIAPEKNRDD